MYALTSTHDWCSDGNARRYDGESVFNDVPFASKNDLNELYGSFGKENEISSFCTSAGFYSRSFRLADGVRLLLINDDCDGKNGKSGFSEEHLRWVEGEARAGRQNGETVIAAEHHLVLPCISPLVNSSQLISDGEEVASRLADAGVRLLFVGHSHMLRRTDFVSPCGETLTQINLGALCGYPASVTYVTVENGRVEIKTEYIEKFTYNGKEYGAEFFRRHAEDVVMNVINGALSDKAELTERLAALGIKAKISDGLFGIIRKGASFLTTVSVGRAAHIVNALIPTGGRIGSKELDGIKKDRLMTYIMPVFLSVFDSSRAIGECPDKIGNVLIKLGEKLSAYARRLPLKAEKKRKAEKLFNGISQTLSELAKPQFEIDTEIIVK